MLQGYFFKNACKVPPPFALVCAGGHHFIAQRSPPGPLHSKPCGTKNVRTAFGFQPLPGGLPCAPQARRKPRKKETRPKILAALHAGASVFGQRVLTPAPSRVVDSTPGKERRRPAPGGAMQAVRNIVAPLFVILSHTPQRRYGIMCPPGGHRPFVLRHLPACITHLRRFS